VVDETGLLRSNI